mgnify:CR=1 FL=1
MKAVLATVTNVLKSTNAPPLRLSSNLGKRGGDSFSYICSFHACCALSHAPAGINHYGMHLDRKKRPLACVAFRPLGIRVGRPAARKAPARCVRVARCCCVRSRYGSCARRTMLAQLETQAVAPTGSSSA